MTEASPYRGRFAPSPTGPLHFGSLVAAVGSFLEAKQQGGEWLLRIEDIDPPREAPGATQLILQTLEHYGFEWDGPVSYQSQRQDAYLDALEQLQQKDLLYPCSCSRKDIAEHNERLGLNPGIYPGTCRDKEPGPSKLYALRLRVEPQQIRFHDRIQGEISQEAAQQIGDFVLRRADGLFSYQLAVVVDDAAQGITDVVRGSDLLDCTPWQIILQHYLGYATPSYCHLPIAVNAEGLKLSKQTLAPKLSLDNPLPSLWQALSFLGQQPPQELLEGELDSFWHWAIQHWRLDAVPHKLAANSPLDLD